MYRRTVRQALASALPPPRKMPVRVSRRLETFKPVIDQWLTDDLDAPRKQRHTARRVLSRLVDEQGAVDVSYSTVRDYVARRRPEIATAAGRQLEQGFVPQTHEPGGEAEVDFADMWVILRGVKTKTFLFTLRLSYSGKSVHRAFITQAQEAFLEGHVAAFSELGGTPIDKIRYDTLKAAVSRVLFGRAGRNQRGGRHLGPTTGSTLSTVTPASKAPTKRAESRGKVAGSAATTASRCSRSNPSSSSTTC